MSRAKDAELVAIVEKLSGLMSAMFDAADLYEQQIYAAAQQAGKMTGEKPGAWLVRHKFAKHSDDGDQLDADHGVDNGQG